jgi:hypothetical protein
MSENQNASGQRPKRTPAQRTPAEREAIRDLIVRNYSPKYQFWVKRSMFEYPEPTLATLYGEIDGVIELLHGSDFQILLYDDLDAMIDDGWEPD